MSEQQTVDQPAGRDTYDVRAVQEKWLPVWEKHPFPLERGASTGRGRSATR